MGSGIAQVRHCMLLETRERYAGLTPRCSLTIFEKIHYYVCYNSISIFCRS